MGMSMYSMYYVNISRKHLNIYILDAYVNRVWEYSSNLSEITPANAEVISHGNELTKKANYISHKNTSL